MPHKRLLESDNTWTSSDDLANDLDDIVQPVDYASIFDNSQLVLIGEDHRNSPVRRHLAAHAAEIKACGTTHYAVESPPSPGIDLLNKDPSYELGDTRVGVELKYDTDPLKKERRESYQEVAKAMVRRGIKVVPIDVDYSRPHYGAEEREVHMTQGLRDIFEADEKAVVAALVGADHAARNRGVLMNGVWGYKYHARVSALSKRLARDGYKISPLRVVGGVCDAPTFFIDAVRTAGLSDEEFMVDLRPFRGSEQHVFSSGNFDWAIHVPQEDMQA